MPPTDDDSVTEPTRWVTDNPESHSDWYVEHFRHLRAEALGLGHQAFARARVVADDDNRALRKRPAGASAAAALHGRE